MGLRWTDYFYPWPQNHAPFLQAATTIRVHIAMSTAALAIGLGGTRSDVSSEYVACLVLGCAAGLLFSFRNPSHDATVTASFAAMGLAPCALCLHSLQASVAALFGAGVAFRLMALALPSVLRLGVISRRSAWIAMIWISWALPLVGVLLFSE